jgi:transposase-like protein
MRLRIQLPVVQPDEYQIPLSCPYGCGGRTFALHQTHEKQLADVKHSKVTVRRYRCVACRRCFRVYPTGVTQAPRSQQLRGVGVLLYVLGLSYGGVVDALQALGWRGSRSSIYRDVQAAGEAVAQLRRQQGEQQGRQQGEQQGRQQGGQQEGRRVRVLSADATYVRCRGIEVTIGVALDALAGDVLDVTLLDSESAEAMRPWLQQLATELGVEVLLSDDLDSYKLVADELGLEHAICRHHVNQNVARLVAELGAQALRMPPATTPPPGVSSSPQQLLDDLEMMQLLVALRPPDGATQLGQLLQRYNAARLPGKQEKATIWYRMRLALMRYQNNWPRLTCDQRWNRRHTTTPHAQLDGTNNVAERAIGWFIKERYRTMRSFKSRSAVRNLAQLIPALAAHPGEPLLTRLLAT